MNYNCHPGQEAVDRAKTLDLGEERKEVMTWLAPHFGYHYGGWYISKVSEGSIAGKAGLQPRDLIVAMDGAMYSDDQFIISKGKLKLLDGQPVTVTVERPGTEGTIDLVFEPPAPAAGTD